MSQDFNAYFARANTPADPELRDHLARAGVVVANDIDLLAADGWVPVQHDGAATGFEVVVVTIDDAARDKYRAMLARAGADPDRFLSILEACDVDLGISCKDPREAAAARAVLTVIASLANGWLSDPQTGTTQRMGGDR